MNNSTSKDFTHPISVAGNEHVILAFFVATFLFGSTGNVLVLVIIGRKLTRTVHDVFIMNLAGSDLSLILFCLPVFIYMRIFDFTASTFYCKVIWPMITVSFCSGIFTITSMAIYRCRVILNPFEPTIETRQMSLWIAALWFFSFIVALPLIVVAKPSASQSCHEDWKNQNYKRAYTVALVALQFILPLFIIFVAYTKIGIELTCTGKRRRDSLTTQGKILDEARREENLKVIKVLATIIVSFAVCMLPGHIAWLILDFGGEKERNVADTIFTFSDVMAVFHSCLNPVIYGTLTKHFRQEYIRYLSMVFCCRCSACKMSCKCETWGIVRMKCEETTTPVTDFIELRALECNWVKWCRPFRFVLVSLLIRLTLAFPITRYCEVGSLWLLE